MRGIDPIRFLIATDVHLGHSQHNEELGNDSYDAFQQVLQIAHSRNVDFLLLGGDLFDEVNPTQKCLYRCLNMLRSNVFGTKQNFSLKVKGMMPNFSNENVNIGLPIFTIHGNHDYPSNDFGKISVCDLLHASNLVNYFGKKTSFMARNSRSMKITPIIFQKPNSSVKLALYGIGYIKDLKFHKLLEDRLVTFQEPADKENTVSILIIHQNRWKGKKGGVGAAYENCVLARYFPEWLDLIIWGHEHEAIGKVQIEDNRRIFQPGSTVITSFIEAESKVKQCILITVGSREQGQQRMRITPIDLQKSYRPMIIRSFSLDEILKHHEVQQHQEFDFQKYFTFEIERMLQECKKLNNPRKPIVRIKIDYTGYQIVRLIKLEQKFSKDIANSFKIFKYSHKTIRKKDKISELSDQEVLDFMKNTKLLQNHRQKDVTTEVLDLFEEEFNKMSHFNFLDINFIKDKIQQLTGNSENKTFISGISNSFKNQLTERCNKYSRDAQQWNQQQSKQYSSIKNALLEQKQRVLKGQKMNFDEIHYKGMINSHKQKYRKKEEEFKPIFCNNISQKIDFTQKTGNRMGPNKNNQKKSSKTPTNTNRDSSLLSDEQNHSHEMQLKSDEDDCCIKAQKSQYQQRNTIQNYRLAEHMLQQKQQKKKDKKKNVDFK